MADFTKIKIDILELRIGWIIVICEI